MIPQRFLILTAALLALVGATAGAQNASKRTIVRYDKPLRSVRLDLATGTVTRGPAVDQRVAATVSDFPNLDLGGFIGADTGNGFCEWFDAGTKGFSGNASDLMNNFVFAYCCSTLAVESGGVGGTTNIGFYEGYVTGGGTSTTAVAVLTLSGLPGNTANNSPFVMGGGTACHLINITFASLVPFSDGPIGYSWHFLDRDITGVWGSTIPFASCVSSCSSPGPDGLGMDWFIDSYCPPGFLRQTFAWGSNCCWENYYFSISMDIREIGDCTATTTTYNSTSPACVDVLSGTPLVVGTTWVAEVTHAPGTASASTLLVRGSKIPGNGASGGTSGGEPRGRLLVSGAFIANLSGTADALAPFLATQLNFTAPIPLQFGLACNEWFAQALTLGAGKQKLSNGLELDTGL